MKNIINYIKNNKLIVFLILIIFFLLYKSYVNRHIFQAPVPVKYANRSYISNTTTKPAVAPGVMMNDTMPVAQETAPNSTKARKTSTNYHISAIVDKVVEFSKGLNDEVIKLGGFVVNSNISIPDNKGGSGYMSIRIPTDKVDELKEYIKDSSIRITSISTNSQDVTDQYEDNEAKLKTLYKTKAIFEDMLDKAKTVDEILKVQQQILRVQDQIDRIKGQQKYLEEISSTSLVTVNFSTEELELPYNPQNAFSPEAIFKQAVRSLMQTINSILGFIIWIGVYAVIWVPVLLIIWVGSKVWKKKTSLKR